MLYVTGSSIDLDLRREYSRNNAIKAKGLGPFDLRRAKGRCDNCASSHVVVGKIQLSVVLAADDL